MWEAAAKLHVKPSVRRKLKGLVQSGQTTQKTARRARVILLAARGVANNAIATETDMSRQAIISLRKRFQETGLDCVVRDAKRPGRKPKLTDERIRSVVEKTLYTKPKNATHWSTRTMAKTTGLSNATIQRIWSDHGLKPHLTRTFKLSKRPSLR